ncbi:DUF2520 domain-containing protein [Paenibacillus sp. TRM 82003]|uniref:Rossmann-like and DUF2520 domain-containing protein n=1 Tax=Kineococcus sp. TRM81007 TaxID=2925831 RepID=UPI001F58E5CA|nr:DUF2520 domain-containing protein [Kineococcus sp. TRM81007]MCI2238909.1 DUF2520 domain-containing protein [Kineococcus sp. TRM81007]MCI3924316.1 DUF2520 domain-containing protein [Paenibacillus sp. TRM 82003]
MNSAGRLDVAVVGAGRVGPVLGAALRAAGHRVTGIAARTRDAAERVEALLPGVPWVDPADAFAADLVLLAVPDDALAPLVAELAPRARPGQLVAHTCGLHGTAVLEPVTAAGAMPAALHPAMTFTGTSLDLGRLRGAVVAVTVPPLLLPIADALVREWGAVPVPVAEEDRPVYHAALAHGANHLVTLVAQALDAAREAVGDAAPDVLRPLLAAALDNALGAGDAALTGPVARGDAGTVAAHLRVLTERAGEGTAATYAQLARVAADRAAAAGRLPAPAAERVAGAVREVLEESRAERARRGEEQQDRG